MALTLAQRFNLGRFFRGEGPEAGPITLVQRRVFILPTRRGLLFAGILFVMLLGSINYNTSLGYGLVFLLSSLSVVSMLHTYRNLLHLCITAAPVKAVFSGEPVSVPVILEAPYPRYALDLKLARQPRRVCDLPQEGWTRVELPMIFNKRGRHPLPRITLRTVYPLGLFRAWAYAQLKTDFLIYPQPAPPTSLPRQPMYHANLSGDRGQGADDFAGLRNYHQGDPLTHVHWKASARGQGMVTKQFGGDRAEELWLEFDAVPAPGIESRLSVLTRWVLDADKEQLSYGLRLPGREIGLGHGPLHRQRCLEALAVFPDGGQR